jgi:hypothetical protein
MTALLLALVGSYVLAALYSIRINPEVRFWKQVYDRKIAWARELESQGTPKMVFIGGSSCAFQIDAGMLTDMGVPSVNMGMHAGMGSRAVAAIGLSAVTPGDYVIWGFEPDRMTVAPELEPLGYQILAATGVLFHDGLSKVALEPIYLTSVMGAMRPGLQHTVTMLAKILSGMPLYRYDLGHMKRGGALSTDIVKVIPTSEPAPFHPDITMMGWTKELSSRLRQVGCPSGYLLPLGYTRAEFAESARICFAQFLAEVKPFLGVVHDPCTGIETNRASFADTYLHMTPTGMESRTRRLAPYLKPMIPQ